MKPIIGLSTTFSDNDAIGPLLHMGVRKQSFYVQAEDYVHGVQAAGGIPVMLPLVETDEERQALLASLDGLLFCGGTDIYPPYYGDEVLPECGETRPDQDAHEIALARMAFRQSQIPVFGICRGIQLMNVALGGTLYQDLATQKKDVGPHEFQSIPRMYGSHTVTISPNSTLSETLGTSALTNTYHHQAVRDLAPGLVATAHALDSVIEAVEAASRPNFFAVQWHPEMMHRQDEKQQALFDTFVAAAARYHAEK